MPPRSQPRPSLLPGRRTLAILATSVLLAGFGFARHRAGTQTDLHITFGPHGLEQLSYLGTVLEDTAAYPADAFHIWHMKATDLQGRPLSGPQYGWGESNAGRTWDAATHTMQYRFTWGTLDTRFEQAGNTLNLIVTTTNHPGSGIVFDGASIYPFALHLPQLPAGFTDRTYNQFSFNTTAPSALLADFGSGEVAAIVPEPTRPLYSGFQPTGNGVSYTAFLSSTTPDSLATFLPHLDRPVPPGQTDTYTVSFRFAPSGTPLATLAADAYAAWARAWPMQLHWPDRRPIGTAYLASSAPGDPTKPAGYRNNPRRYFNSNTSADFDITTAAGLARFQARILAQAAANVQNLRRLGAQGAITWDIEGQQYPQSTSYVCAPDQIAEVAPEMESVIHDPVSPFIGRKLDDAYFSIMRTAGFRVGVCVRPQHFTQHPDGTATQVFLPDAAIAAELLRKMRFAHDRWGATLFYIDSTVEPNGAALDPALFQQLAVALPDSLLIPEETVPKDYAYTAPFQSFLFHGDTGTDPTVRAYYPHAFSAILINDVAGSKLAAARPALTSAFRAGDIPMLHIDYWHPDNDAVLAMEQATHQSAPVSGEPAP